MRILIGQPIHESGVKQLEREIQNNKGIDIVLYPEGYLTNEKALDDACKISRDYNITIITSYRHENRDRAVIISNKGEKVLERAKTPPAEEEKLYRPLAIEYNEITIGYLLCMEILKGARDLKEVNIKINFIAHPIGVGMFSDEQFEEWISEAKKIAKTYNTIIVGTSHADGSYRNCGISIPISYYIDSNGEPIFISKSDTRTRLVDLNTGVVEFTRNL
ncbi:hypothetical protein [Clostridium chromiireducens]|uniref:CN hydrolase domain-containing protein n=1 Tax=Clostridium chromiireducens TaxID=225345 RepID=A0A1V4ISP2_9CLOT|nr:hypothetical protein [Clostridium chromiireducens]OPJ62830.1 hypothetical protein CLCHR_18900 [Clostridium chromiireducens]RII33135.1 hypothetical protein D2A34_20115 [Clostridium chromiireducens]